MSQKETKHTVLVEKYQNAAKKNTGLVEGYKGLSIHTLPGLHNFVFAQIQERCKAGDLALDLAAGTGAMSQRLLDFGYPVIAMDYVTENFQLHGKVPFFQTDLNYDFSQGREEQFSLVVATEIVEHLENPRHFARECFKLLKPGGKVFLTTPNIDNVASTVLFLRTGKFDWFSDAQYVSEGHITPLSQWQLDRCFSEVGFRFLWKGSYGDPLGSLKGSPRLALLYKLLNMAKPTKDTLKGQIFAMVAEKPGNAQESGLD